MDDPSQQLERPNGQNGIRLMTSNNNTGTAMLDESDSLAEAAAIQEERNACLKAVRSAVGSAKRASIKGGDALAAFVYFGSGDGETSARSICRDVEGWAWETCYDWLRFGGIRASLAALGIPTISAAVAARILSKDIDADEYGRTEDAVGADLAVRLRAFADYREENPEASESAAAKGVTKTEAAEAVEEPEAAEAAEAAEATGTDPESALHQHAVNFIRSLTAVHASNPEAAADQWALLQDQVAEIIG